MHRVMYLVLLLVHTLVYIISRDASRVASGVVLRAYSRVALGDVGDVASRVAVGAHNSATFHDANPVHEEAIKAKRR